MCPTSEPQHILATSHRTTATFSCAPCRTDSVTPTAMFSCFLNHADIVMSSRPHLAQVLLEVLNARLADIREWWVTGALETRGFGAPQVHPASPYAFWLPSNHMLSGCLPTICFLDAFQLPTCLDACSFVAGLESSGVKGRQMWHAVVVPQLLIPALFKNCKHPFFTCPSQVAHLVRALFEPTEMRAQLLDEIGG